MLSIKRIMEETDSVKLNLARKGVDPKVVDNIITLELQRRKICLEEEKLNLEICRLQKELEKIFIKP